jgi:hypothetical protein
MKLVIRVSVAPKFEDGLAENTPRDQGRSGSGIWKLDETEG